MGKTKQIKLNELSVSIQDVYNVLNNEIDIAKVLISTSFLSEQLNILLKEKLGDSKTSKELLDSKTGLLSTFASRCKLSYCLGLIEPWIYKDLLKIAEIRNLFAHTHLILEFTNQEIQTKCNELSSWKMIYAEDLDSTNTPKSINKNYLAKNQFVFSAVMLMNQLLVKAKSMQRIRKLNLK